MRRIREILRLHFDCRLSNEKVASALKISKGGVSNTLARFRAANLSWPLPEGLSDSQIEERLYKPPAPVNPDSLPDYASLEIELRRPHVTRQLLWEEYRAACSQGVSRASFYRGLRAWRSTRDLPMKIDHKAGDKLFVDYSGDSLEYACRKTGVATRVELFVCCWGASGYCYAEASESQNQEDFTRSHVRALDYFGCAPAAFVPDNLKSGVVKPSLYEPTVNALYAATAAHYGAAVLPARARKPRDKAAVENAVLHLQRHILGRLRDRTFTDLAQINEAIAEELETFNDRPMKSYGGQSRRERFETIDKPHARELPAARFAITKIKTGLRVAPNYHVQFAKRHYSVPHELARSRVEVYQVGDVLEIYRDGKHICRHPKGKGDYGYTTNPEHMPERHRFVRGWSSEYFRRQAALVGERTLAAVEEIMKRRKHPEQGYKAAMGLLRLASAYTPERLDRACARALHFDMVSYRSVKSVLEKNLDALPLTGESQTSEPPPEHENLRGADYYLSNQPINEELEYAS